MKIAHFYYGAWNNFYHLSWPWRFLIELLVSVLILKYVLRLIKNIVRKLRLDLVLIKSWVWFVTEVVYLIGRNRNWAVEIDNRMIEWGEKAVNHTDGKKSAALKKCMFVIVIIVYFSAVLVDLPFANGLEGYYLSGFTKIKLFCQKYEEMLSGDCEQYPPLFRKREPESDESAMALEDLQNEIEPVYIQLNDQGRDGSNIRKEPSMNGAVVGGVNGTTEILYQQQFENDGERYWIKVYIPHDAVEGWLSGNLIDSEQLESIIMPTD